VRLYLLSRWMTRPCLPHNWPAGRFFHHSSRRSSKDNLPQNQTRGLTAPPFRPMKCEPRKQEGEADLDAPRFESSAPLALDEPSLRPR
jgi:hypothetical protein